MPRGGEYFRPAAFLCCKGAARNLGPGEDIRPQLWRNGDLLELGAEGGREKDLLIVPIPQLRVGIQLFERFLEFRILSILGARSVCREDKSGVVGCHFVRFE